MEKLKKTIVAVFTVVILTMPVVSIAGDLEPSGPPAPTMKTLDQIPPTWSLKLPATDRFVVLVEFNNGAVLDKETGLVWERSPSTSTYTWLNASYYCTNLNVGGRKGWHLPTIEQLASLVDTSAAGSVKLPNGHPFSNVQSNYYWSATIVPDYNLDVTIHWAVWFTYGEVNYGMGPSDKHAWCVRGGETYSNY